MLLTVNFSSYNSRRMGRPWIAKIVAWPIGGRPEFSFGVYLGGDQGGAIQICSEVSDVIRYGQKDFRGNGTVSKYAIVLIDGTLLHCDEPTAAEVYRNADRYTLVANLVNRRDQRIALNDAHEAWMQTQRDANVQGWTFSPEYKQRTAALKSELAAIK